MTSMLTRFGFVVHDARALAGAAGWAARSIPTKPTPPILGGMPLEIVEPGTLRVSGFDLDVCGTSVVTVQGESVGRVVVSGRLLAEVLKTLPGKPLEVSADDKALTLKCGTTRLSLPLMTAEDYPPLPDAAAPLGTVDAQQFARLILRTAVAADLRGDTTLPSLTGVYLDFGGDGMLTAIGTNRYRAADAAKQQLATGPREWPGRPSQQRLAFFLAASPDAILQLLDELEAARHASSVDAEEALS